MYHIPILGVMAVGFLAMGFDALPVSFAASTEPGEITCERFAANGPGDNAHVVLAETVLSAPHVRHIERVDGTREIWVPALPKGRSHESSRVLVRLSQLKPPDKTTRLSDESVQKLRAVSANELWVRAVESAGKTSLLQLRNGKLDAMLEGSLADLWNETIEAEYVKNSPIFAQPRVRGVVLNNIENPGDDVVKKLREAYPWVGTDQLWFVAEGREPLSRSFVVTLLVLGGLLAVGTLWSVFSAYSRRGASTPEAGP